MAMKYRLLTMDCLFFCYFYDSPALLIQMDMRKLFLLSFLLCCLQWDAFSQQSGHSTTFIPNEGQWEEPFLYKGVGANADIYLERDGITYVVGAKDNPEKVHEYKEGHLAEPPQLSFHAYRVKWVGARKHPVIKGGKKQPYYHNYYLGNDAARWKSNVGIFGVVDYEDIYPAIDLHIGSEKGDLKYDFILKPGADYRNIQLAFEGVEKISLQSGNLLLKTSVGTVTEVAPYAYQYIDGELKEVPCRYKLDRDRVSFVFPKGYDTSVSLTLDPTIVFATLTGSVSDNWGFTATYDQGGNLYAGGIVAGNNYPITPGAFQLTYGGGTSGSQMPCDISLSKFNASGTGMVYSTFLGGSQNDMPHSLIVDKDGNLIVAGKTLSVNYPTTSNAYDQTHNGSYDIIVTKFNPSGTALLASTYIGGTGDDGVNMASTFNANKNALNYNYGDGYRTEVLCDRQGNIYVAACSRSSNFPVTFTAAKSSLGGAQDGVFFKFDPQLSTLLYSTYIGGANNDAAYVLALDTAQTHVYVAGGTQSTDFHTATTAGSWQPAYQGGMADGYILRFQNSGNYPLLKTTFVGTSGYDQCFGVQVDLENNVYAMGQTLGNFPVSTGVYSNPNSRHFLVKLDSTLGNVQYSTVFGSGATTFPSLSLVAFLVDTCQNVYLSGWGGAINSTTTQGLPTTANAFQPGTDGNDFYFIVFSKNLTGLLFASFFGSAGKGEHVDGGTSRFDPQGVVYQAMCASCGNANTPQSSQFPATPGAYSSTKGSPSTNCNLGAVKIAFNLGRVDAAAAANPSATGCAPLVVNFGNTSSNATSYEWDFGDNTQSTQQSPTHTYTAAGIYNVRMIASNPNACKTHDTVYLQIVVSTDTIHADFTYELKDTCTSPKIVLDNLSTPMAGHSLGDATFQWFFGDNTSATGASPGPHTYAGPGTYSVTMVMTDPDACNSPDTVTKTVVIEQLMVHANFQARDSICVGDTLNLSNSSLHGTQYKWDFGEGQGNSSEFSPKVVYASPGTYIIKLIVQNASSCNKADTLEQVITVSPVPTAAFAYSPLMPEKNVPTTFDNQSLNADSYKWDFGDGNTSTEKNPQHYYTHSGNFKVCLTAFNLLGCRSVTCRTVLADVTPLADLPTAFSPNGDGANDVLFVRGFNIESIDLKIFNRWGELVFETLDKNVGWNGTYKGEPQEMDVYGYVLSVKFLDGTHMKKQGNVTLLR